MKDPVIIAMLVGCAALIVLSIIGRIRRRLSDALQSKRIRGAVREQRHYLERRQAELEQLAGRIIATSSTDSIIGFSLVRQIEAVFADGHPTPEQAVLALKAIAAEKGANGIINLHSTRPPAGKCMAYGDAVIMNPIAEQPKTGGITDVRPTPDGAMTDDSADSRT